MRKYLVILMITFSMLIGLFVPFNTADASYSPNKVISVSKKYIGVKYKYGGMSPKGFDCSGFVGYTVKKATGKKLPRSAAGIYKSSGKKVSKKKLKKGDIVFFATTKKSASHTGIYIGNKKFIHASSSKGVRIDSLNGYYWKDKFLGAKRL